MRPYKKKTLRSIVEQIIFLDRRKTKAAQIRKLLLLSHSKERVPNKKVLFEIFLSVSFKNIPFLIQRRFE